METQNLLKTAINAIEAVRNHYEEAYEDHRLPEDSPHPGDIINKSNSCLSVYRYARCHIPTKLEIEKNENG